MCRATGLYYVAMQLVRYRRLSDVLARVPRKKISRIIFQVASAARFLEEQELSHRDIKPDNICISRDFSTAILLDLGVLKPIGADEITGDERGTPFIGTLRYSPIEFALSEVEDTVEGWRAVTFYQLGGVLHDLITREKMFADIEEPYAKLVLAIQGGPPQIGASDDVLLPLVGLAQRCLVGKASTYRCERPKPRPHVYPLCVPQGPSGLPIPDTLLAQDSDMRQ